MSSASGRRIQLESVEMEGRLERGPSGLEARGGRHATDVRRLSVERDGVQVGTGFEGLRGVLTGLPVPSKES